jgi:hypothetical protein
MPVGLAAALERDARRPAVSKPIALSSLFASLILSAGCGGAQMDDDAIPAEESSELADDDGPGIGYQKALFFAHLAGVPCNSRAVVAVAVARAESGLNDRYDSSRDRVDGDLECRNRPRGCDYGLWRLSEIFGAPDELLVAGRNATIMAELSKNGSDFKPWRKYGTGEYRQYLAQAWAAQSKYHCE